MARSHASDDDDTDALLDALEQEDSNSAYTAQRIAQLKSELSSSTATPSDQTTSTGGGVTTLLNNSPLPALPNDQAVLDFTTQLSHCVIHFFHPDFSRCAAMDRHLTLLSTAHSGTGSARFARADVRNLPFVVEKLKIRVLPCVLGFVDGEVRERVLGFEGLGPRGLDALGDDFDTGVLEERLVKKGVLSAVKVGRRGGDDDYIEEEEDREEGQRRVKKSIRSGGRKGDDDDSDWD